MGKILVGSPLVVTEQSVPFTYESGILTLQQVFPGNLIDTAWVIIEEAAIWGAASRTPRVRTRLLHARRQKGKRK